MFKDPPSANPQSQSGSFWGLAEGPVSDAKSPRRASNHSTCPAILAHVYGTEPTPSTRIVVFRLHRARGTHGTVLSGALPPTLNRYGYLEASASNCTASSATEARTHSYLSAACAAPAGFSRALFTLAHTSLGFSDGRTLAGTLIRSCTVSG